VAASADSHSDVFVHFTSRLHPWTTIKELKQNIFTIKGYHVHRQRLFVNNSELLNSETLDYYGLLQEQHPDDIRNTDHINLQSISDTQTEQSKIDDHIQQIVQS